MRDFPLVWIFFSLLLIIPLADTISRFVLPSSLVWNDFGWLMLLFIFGSLLLYQTVLRKNLVLFALVASILFLLNIFLSSPEGFLASSFLRYLVFVWFFIPLFTLKRFYSPLLLGFILLGVICLQAQWGIAQFIFQHDLGFYILGESHISTLEPGIAKFLVGETKLIRAYGPYQHTNLFGAVSVIGVLLSILIATFTPKIAKTLYLRATAFVFLLAMLLSFSRAAYLSLVIGLLVMTLLFWKEISTNVPLRSFGRSILLIFLLTSLLFMPLFLARSSDPEDQAFSARSRGYEFAGKIISGTPHLFWRGVGVGNYVPTLRSFLTQNSIRHEVWEEASLHNSIFLAAIELGYLSFAILLVCGVALFWRLKHAARKTTTIFVLALLPVALLDHFLVTQTSVLFIALAAAFFGAEMAINLGRRV